MPGDGGRKMTKRLGVIAAVLLFAANGLYAEFLFGFETGLVFSGYNDVGIPGDTGTRFSLHDDLDPESSAFFRARLGYVFGGRHTVSLLVAPFSMDYSGTLDTTLDFAGKTFSSGTKVDAVYRFDSYRVSYRWDFLKEKIFDAGIGLTGKIRDAEISLDGGGTKASKANIGFVPLINIRLALRTQK
jgi:hypothetical protein